VRLIRFIKAELAGDARGWVDDGLLSTEQAQAILARYGTELGAERQGLMGYYTLLVLAAGLVGLGAILLVGSNWHDIPRTVRLVGLLGLTVAANGAGILRVHRDEDGPATFWLVLGAFLYGASIFLIGQMYHLGEHFPEGILLWAVGILPMAWVARSHALMLLHALVAGVWLCVEFSAGQDPWIYLPLAAAQLVFALGVMRSVPLFLGAAVGTVTAIDMTLVRALERSGLGVHLEPLILAFALSLILYLVARHMSTSADHTVSDYGSVLHLWTARFGVLALLPFSFAGTWKEVGDGWADSEFGMIVAFVAVATLAALLSAAWLLRESRDGWKDALPGLAFAGILGVGTALIPWVEANSPVLAQILVTLALLAIGLWLIVRGIQTTSAASFYLGAATIAMTALLRYFDLVGDYIGTSIVFMVCGAAMAGAAGIWKRAMAAATPETAFEGGAA